MDLTNDLSESNASTEDDVRSISRSSQSQSRDQIASLPDSQDGVNMEGHRNMMLASLLEDYYYSRALEFLSTANPGRQYTRQSREVQAVANRLFTQASRVLSSNGLLSSRATSDESQTTRRQYLLGLDSLVAGSQASNIPDSMRDLVTQTSQLSLSAHPANDLQLTLRQPPPPPRSHYQSSFREESLLGKGGFGKVYKCYNLLDQKTYAVKKITLPPKLVKGFRDGRHDDLQHILREVKAMAMLDHPNIVRYHATWFEEPQQSPQPMIELENMIGQSRRQNQQLLLDSHPFEHGSEQESSTSYGIVFEEDTLSSRGTISNENDQIPSNRGWSEDDLLMPGVVDTTSASESDVFTGGATESENSIPGQASLETNVHALYIQMSMYPMTLAQFITPSSASDTALQHCFHLVPTLRLSLSILEGLQYIHSKGLIHQDIKPGNIFLSSPERTFEIGYCDLSCKMCTESQDEGTQSRLRWLNPRIGDFGLVHQLAKAEVPSSSSQSSAELEKDAGTAYYQPPHRGEKRDEKIDIFALGVVFVEMLCRCNTAMERVNMLKELQVGKVPQVLPKILEAEGHDSETAARVIQLASSMTEGDSEKRWPGSKVREVLQELLSRCGAS
ncbi:kinase-like protein [Xylariaceae sp. FL1651]|nr:kinase-like protein [Xylariaceae sp. FL1651]